MLRKKLIMPFESRKNFKTDGPFTIFVKLLNALMAGHKKTFLRLPLVFGRVSQVKTISMRKKDESSIGAVNSCNRPVFVVTLPLN